MLEALLAPPRARGVLLDLDGTLLDTAPDLIGSLNALRVENGLSPLPSGHLQPVVSHGSGPMIQRGFNLQPADPGFEPLRQRFLDLYRARSVALPAPSTAWMRCWTRWTMPTFPGAWSPTNRAG